MPPPCRPFPRTTAAPQINPAVDAFRLGVYALARLKNYDALAASVLDASGQPRTQWWPVAYAIQRTEDKRAGKALLAMVGSPSAYAQAFAIKGLGQIRDESAVPTLLPLVDRRAGVEPSHHRSDPGAGQDW